jgi:mitogen-activated protein kinase kinase kinase 7
VIHEHDREISIENLYNWSLQIATGLAFIHRNLHIHRDLKPLKSVVLYRLQLFYMLRIFSSCLLANNYEIVKIGDFGTARDEIALPMTTHTGTSIYMAPEVFDNPNYTLKCDVYSFGITLYEMFTRKRPFADVSKLKLAEMVRNGHRPTMSNEQVDRWMQSIIERYNEIRDK